MIASLTEIRQMIVPGRESKQGPLPPLLLSMTLVTGLVDAFSYLALGHVFVANMTGNVVLLGFALVGVRGFSVAASLVAIAAFALGGAVGGRIGSRLGQHRGRHLSAAAAVQVVFLGTGVVLAALSQAPVPAGYRYALIVVLAIAMGVQNATARKLAVPDLTTTVLTMTITGIASDGALGGGNTSHAGRRLVAVATMLAGAVLGGAMIVHVSIVYPLATALVLMLCVAASAKVLSGSNPAWVRPQS